MMNHIAEQFQMLNGHIASAISEKDYARAATLDQARQSMLKDICLMDMQSIDAEFFALIEECEATLKYFRREGAMVRLDPANRAYDPQRYPPDHVRVQGKLSGILRRYD